jgi:hypothetical protein
MYLPEDGLCCILAGEVQNNLFFLPGMIHVVHLPEEAVRIVWVRYVTHVYINVGVPAVMFVKEADQYFYTPQTY